MIFLNEVDIQYLISSRQADWRRAATSRGEGGPDVRTRVRAAWRGFRDPAQAGLGGGR